MKAVVHLLLGNLNTPSQQVQEAIAACLPPLASVIKPDAEDILKKLLDKVKWALKASESLSFNPPSLPPLVAGVWWLQSA